MDHAWVKTLIPFKPNPWQARAPLPNPESKPKNPKEKKSKRVCVCLCMQRRLAPSVAMQEVHSRRTWHCFLCLPCMDGSERAAPLSEIGS